MQRDAFLPDPRMTKPIHYATTHSQQGLPLKLLNLRDRRHAASAMQHLALRAFEGLTEFPSCSMTRIGLDGEAGGDEWVETLSSPPLSVACQGKGDDT